MEFDSKCSDDIIADVYSDLRSNFHSARFDLDTILAKIFSKRGKGIRPVFMCLMAKMAGGSWENVRKAAMIIEAIHLASLLHDDVLDGADIRRGDTTLNAQYSDKVSILFGDHIFVNAIIMTNQLRHTGAVSVIHNAVKRMVEGEICDTLKGDVITEDAYIRIIGDKTASLFAASGELGMILSGADDEKKVLARELGELLGTAFQIIDDTLDYNGDAEKMGKPTFLDVTSNTMTLPLIYSLRDMNADEIQLFLAENANSTENILELVKQNGGIEYANNRAREFSDKGREIMSRFKNKEAYDMFGHFFEMLMKRHF